MVSNKAFDNIGYDTFLSKFGKNVFRGINAKWLNIKIRARLEIATVKKDVPLGKFPS